MKNVYSQSSTDPVIFGGVSSAGSLLAIACMAAGSFDVESTDADRKKRDNDDELPDDGAGGGCLADGGAIRSRFGSVVVVS